MTPFQVIEAPFDSIHDLGQAGGSGELTYHGLGRASATFSSLRSEASGTVDNVFYDPDNNFQKGTGSVPTVYTSQSIAEFTQTLSYGSQFINYTSTYVLRLSGTIVGGSGYVFVELTHANQPSQFWFFNKAGNYSINLLSRAYVHGQFPQEFKLNVRTGFDVHTQFEPEGSTVSGGAFFGSTVQVVGIDLRDDDGNLQPQGTITSDSGEMFPIISALAIPYTVTKTADTDDGVCDGDCSLREAVKAANATAEDEIINFAIPADDPNCTPDGACTITLTNGELTIADNGSLTINGSGEKRLTISGNNASRVFSVESEAEATITDLSVTNGNPAGAKEAGERAEGGLSGGGILNGGTLTLSNLTLSGNTTPGSGGGVTNNHILTMTNSTVSGNTAGYGGGIENSMTLNLSAVTVTNNNATLSACDTCAGGIFNDGLATTNLDNTIVARNTAANASAPPDFGGAISSGSSYNLIGNNQGTTGISGGTNGNLVGTLANPIDPLLGPLQDNGGLNLHSRPARKLARHRYRQYRLERRSTRKDAPI